MLTESLAKALLPSFWGEGAGGWGLYSNNLLGLTENRRRSEAVTRPMFDIHPQIPAISEGCRGGAIDAST